MAGQICKSLSTGNNLFKFLAKQVYKSSITVNRRIYGNSYLMIDGYLETKEKAAVQFRGMKDKFLAKLSEYSKEDSQAMVFTEDLKHMAHLVENNEEELNLLITMIKKYNKQNEEMRFSTFIFGPVIMRCLHHFGDADRAYSLLIDESLAKLFNQFNSYVVAMDLLWKKEQYEKVLEIFQIFQNRQVNQIKFPRDPVLLYLAACYKLNTLESLNRARNLIKEVSEAEAFITRKSALFAVSLALNQNLPEMAMEVLSLIRDGNYFTVKNLKIITLAKLDRVAESFEILKVCLDRDSPPSSNFTTAQISEETLKTLRSEIERLGNNKNDLATLDRLEKCLMEENILSKDSIDVMLCAPIMIRHVAKNDSRPGSGYESRFYERSNDRHSKRPQQTFRSRPGLLDTEQ